MSFAKGAKEGSKRWEHYLLTIGLTFLGLISGSVVSYKIALYSENIRTNPGGWMSFGVQLLPFAVGLTVFFLCVRFIHKAPILSVVTSRKSFDFKRFFLAFGIWLSLLVLFLIVAVAFGTPIEIRWELEKILPLLLVSLILLPIQTAFEDVLYRGYLLQGLTNAVGKAGLSVLILGVLFGWMHSGNPEVKTFGYGIVWFYVISGLFMGILAHLDDGLELGMGYHFANNFFGAVILTNTWQVFQTDALILDLSNPYFGWENWATLLLVQPMLLFLFYKIYRWKNPLQKIKD